ncbi:hypothetical protein [Duganella vulcania]|uniref:Uncharacterized protein n=1 Tax=Duganella vulcania TaxID=2692166 RepID=A0A845GUU9_9BURK|nr:hypothetical protein [Duganella vulcania]MYM96447.1 hypothetical protein [Duganella vulcania]
MKKALLILMMLLLPWQTATAMQRNLVHLLGGGADAAVVSKHIAEHEAHVPHHHDDDDDDDDDDAGAGPHEDHSSKSVQHLSDYEHGGSLQLLLQAPAPLPVSAPADAPPVFAGLAYSDRTTLPPLRPPCLPA